MPSPHENDGGSVAQNAALPSMPAGPMDFGGLRLNIENPIGTSRTGYDLNGERWETPMNLAHYGELEGTMGADGDPVDVYLVGGGDPGQPAYVIDQYDLDGAFDEHKVVLGAASEAEALRVYDAGFTDGSGPKRRGAVTSMALASFNDWAHSVAVCQPAGPVRAPLPRDGEDLLSGQPPAQPWTGHRSVVPVDAAFLAAVAAGQPITYDAAHGRVTGRFTPANGGAWLVYSARGQRESTSPIPEWMLPLFVRTLTDPALAESGLQLLDSVSPIMRATLAGQLVPLVAQLKAPGLRIPDRLRLAAEARAILAKLGPLSTADDLTPDQREALQELRDVAAGKYDHEGAYPILAVISMAMVTTDRSRPLPAIFEKAANDAIDHWADLEEKEYTYA